MLGLDEWVIAEGGGYEGAQRLANLERLLHTLRRERPIDLGAAADFVETRTTRETEDEESPLFDEGLEAVRVMTVHASKGLEFELVVVPDLVRQPTLREPPSEARVERAFADQNPLVGIAVGTAKNAAMLALETEQRKHRAAEEMRLLYVAMTRAKRELILIGGHGARHGSWQERLDACRELPAVVHERTIDPSRARRASAAADAGAETLAAWRAHESLRAELLPAPTPAPAHDLAPAPAPAPTPGADATELGIAVHRYLALVAPTGPRDDDLIAALDRPAFEGALTEIVARFHESALLTRIASADRALRELPVSYLDADRTPQHGVIDLLLEEGGTWTIVDHKTDRVADGAHAAAAEAHRPQLDRYADGVQRALGLATPPARVVWFARDDVLVTL